MATVTNTVVLETERIERHPSFPDGMPAIVAEPVEHGYCTDCASLAAQIRASERLGDADGMVAYGRVAVRHVSAAHPSYGIHNIGADDVRETRQSYNSGGAR